MAEGSASDAGAVWMVEGGGVVLVINRQGLDAVGAGSSEAPANEPSACLA